MSGSRTKRRRRNSTARVSRARCSAGVSPVTDRRPEDDYRRDAGATCLRRDADPATGVTRIRLPGEAECRCGHIHRFPMLVVYWEDA
ncbi:MAG: hypothetical protein NTZ98_09635 [Acidobacteria bacterium]|nr:hypothetical protein [Acidobacteriota bacterium]